jgi:CsoR family transcriptional regulator, copper-sensing transcriptional repressor
VDVYTNVNPPGGDGKQMINSHPNTKREILHRYQIAKGHLEKVIAMLQADSYCINVVHQSLAVQAAMKKADEAVLKNHLETCVADSIKKGESTEAIAEVMAVLKKRS